MEFSLSSDNGKPCVIFQNKQFFPTSNINVGSRVVFKCSDVKCLSRIVIQGNEIVKRYHKHTCDDNVNWIESSELSEISRRTRTKSLKTYEEKQLVDDYNSFFDDDSSSPRPVPSTRKKKRKYVFKGDSRRSSRKRKKPSHYTKVFTKEERIIFLDLIEKYYEAIVGPPLERAKWWDKILLEYNNSVEHERSLDQLKKCMMNMKCNMKRHLTRTGLTGIYGLSQVELRALSLIPKIYFEELFDKEELARCIEEASTAFKVTNNNDNNFVNSSNQRINEIVMDDDSQSSYYDSSESSESDEVNPLAVSTVDSSSMDEQIKNLKNPFQLPHARERKFIQKKPRQNANMSFKSEDFSVEEESFAYEGYGENDFTEIDVSQVEPARQIQLSFQSGQSDSDKTLSKATSDEELLNTANPNDIMTTQIYSIQSLKSNPKHLAFMSEKDTPKLSELNSIENTKLIFPNTVFEFKDNSLSSSAAPSNQPISLIFIPPQDSPQNIFDAKNYIKERMNMEETMYKCEMENLAKERENLDEKHNLEMEVLQHKLKFVQAQYEEMNKRAHALQS